MPITTTTQNPRVNYRPEFGSKNFNRILWADLPLNMDISPVTGDLLRVVNTACVQQSMESIINTYAGERPYSNMGTSLQLRLFENGASLEIEMIKQAVQLSLRQYESRAIVHQVNVVVNPNGNYYTMTIVWSLINSTEQQSFNMILQRNR